MTSIRLLRVARRALPALAGAILAGAVSACSMFAPPPPPPPCPDVARVEDAARLTRFAGEGRDLTDVAFEAEIGPMQGSCAYDDDEIDIELSIQIVASRGPADENRRADFRYFVAIAKAGQTILAREEFDSYIEFPGNRVRAGIFEELLQRIPIREGESGANYVIYAGFVLTPEELAFNRSQQ